MRATGTILKRYPDGDPENGPAYNQRWNGTSWECANHKFECYSDIDPETKEEYKVTACKYCGGEQ